jgi:hypothetical protein
MDDRTVFTKTPLGNDEILRRSVGLPNDLRSLLLLIDGRRDVATLRQLNPSLRESLAQLVFLEDNGFVGQQQMMAQAIGADAQMSANNVAQFNQRRGILADIQGNHLSQRVTTGQQPAVPNYPPPGSPGQGYEQQQVPMQQSIAQRPMQQTPIQQAPMQQAPMQQAPMQQVPGHVLNDLKIGMIQFVNSSLGADGGHAISRIQSAQNTAELQQIAKKIYEILKAYSGVKPAERFMQQFEGPLNLR